jgi:hypothetical protein
MSSSSRPGSAGAPPPRFSTGCTEGCGNVDYSTFANCGFFVSWDPCGRSGEALDSLMRRARRGSRTKQHREVVRGGPQGPRRKVDRSCGRNRDRLGEFFFLVRPSLRRRPLALDYDRRDASPAAEHRPGRHCSHLGGLPRGVHLLRAHRRRCERRYSDRDRARLVRGDLAACAPPRRGEAGGASPRSPSVSPVRYAARRPGRCGASAKTSFRASSLPSRVSRRSRAGTASGSRLSRWAASRCDPRSVRFGKRSSIPVLSIGRPTPLA